MNALLQITCKAAHASAPYKGASGSRSTTSEHAIIKMIEPRATREVSVTALQHRQPGAEHQRVAAQLCPLPTTHTQTACQWLHSSTVSPYHTDHAGTNVTSSDVSHPTSLIAVCNSRSALCIWMDSWLCI